MTVNNCLNIGTKTVSRSLIQLKIPSKSTSIFCCDECGSNNIQADHRGYYVCHGCGLTIDLPVIPKNLASYTKTIDGKTILTHSYIQQTGTLIGSRSERISKNYLHLAQIQNMLNILPENRAYIVFHQLCAKFDIPFVYKKFLPYFQKIYSQMQISTRSRNVVKFCSTLFIIITRHYGQSLCLKKVLDYMKISLQDYYAIRTAIHRVNPHIGTIPQIEFEHAALQLASRIVDQYQFGFLTYQCARYLILHYRKYIGEKINIVAGVAVALAAQLLCTNKKTRLFHLAKNIGISASTLYTRVNNFPQRILSRIESTALKSQTAVI